MGDLITMSNRELTRVEVLQRPVNKRLKESEAAHLLSQHPPRQAITQGL